MEAARPGEIRSNQFCLLPNGGQSVAPCAINLSAGHLEKNRTKEKKCLIRPVNDQKERLHLILAFNKLRPLREN